jgi:hypothetical protein
MRHWGVRHGRAPPMPPSPPSGASRQGCGIPPSPPSGMPRQGCGIPPCPPIGGCKHGCGCAPAPASPPVPSSMMTPPQSQPLVIAEPVKDASAAAMKRARRARMLALSTSSSTNETVRDHRRDSYPFCGQLPHHSTSCTTVCPSRANRIRSTSSASSIVTSPMRPSTKSAV